MNKKKLMQMINASVETVRNLTLAGNMEEATAEKEKLVNLRAQYDAIVEAEEMAVDMTPAAPSGFVDPLAAAQNLNAAADPNPQNIVTPNDGEQHDSVHDFAVAARRGFHVTNTAIADGLRESSDPNGGYVVPQDIQTRINDYKEAEFSLESLINVEATTRSKGTRVYEKKSEMTGFADIDEGAELPEMDTPNFENVSYAIGDRGGWLPLTNDLLADTDQNIMERVTRWIARKSNATSNTKIKALINAKTAGEIETLDEVNKAIIVTLGGAYRASAQILTNDDGLLFLSTLKDTTKRPLLYPDPMNAMQMILSVGPLRIPIVAVPNEVIASNIATAGKRKIPFISGDFKEAFTKYDRQLTTLMSSNVAVAGKLNAFTQNLTLVRAIERNDFKTIDSSAYVNQLFVTDDSTVVGG